jgi:phospholipid/cholesterol/gamma-HCH transport system substrate-binding protein
MFTVLIALGVFTIVLSRESFFKKSYQYEYVFSEVSGLREGDNVYLRGMNVGRVRQISLENSQVHVYVTVDVPITLRRNYSIDVVNASMLGGKYLKVYEGPDTEPELGENVTILGSTPVDVIEELSAAVSGIQAMIDSVNQGQGTLGKLLTDDTIYNNMVSVSEKLKNLGDRLDSGQGTIGKLFMEDEVYNDTQQMMANFREISERLAAGEGTLGMLMSSDTGVYEDFGATMSSIRSISEQISSGQGTLGKLVRDDRLYDETALLVEDMRAAIDDLREASPITSFSSVLFGAF